MSFDILVVERFAAHACRRHENDWRRWRR